MLCDCWRQLWLLTCKNLIITKRSKLWTLFELILPIIFTLPIVILIVKNSSIHVSEGRSFKDVQLEGAAADIPRPIGFVSSIKTRWCNRQEVQLAYYAPEISQASADNFMNKVVNRYTTTIFILKAVKFETEEALLEQLRLDAPNNTLYGCAINKYAGGVIFDQIDIKRNILDYRILIPSPLTENIWHIKEEWDDPFGATIDQNSIPGSPPYWSSGFLTFQYAIDSLFIEAVSPNVTLQSDLRVRRIPEAAYDVNSVAAFLSIASYIWGLCAFVLVIHTARVVASERSSVKDFLSVMGLSTPIFYLSHVLFAALKCLIVLMICSIPISTVLGPVSVSLFLIIMILYGLSTVTFAAMISSCSRAPNTVLKVVIVLWVVLVGLPIKAPKVDEIFPCFLFSLNPNAAFSYALKGIADYMNRGRELSWWNIFEDGSFHFTVGAAFIMLLLDILWMGAAMLMIDIFFSDQDFTLFKLPFRNSYLASSGTRLDDVEGNNETDEGLLHTRVGISVHRLIKVWSSTNERAVDEMFMEAYVGQVTVLLGHNGAGKSTTFSVISGITAPTSGTVSIYDLDIRKDRSACRKRIGLCPQSNALFDRLTVNEHLWFIHGLKGAKGSYKAEADQLLSQLKLDEKADDIATSLSGGQKRKLCVSMAVIGGSPVVLLDEPTAGMDPGARRDVETLLESIKVDRTVLLTTHYMDEAELLGDRVAIMAKGRVYCCGTPQFLKKRFGTGYVMTVVVAEKANAQDIASQVSRIASQYVNGATRGKVHGKQFEIILPKEEQKNFPSLFEHLEKSKLELRISSFGLSLNTLEQVFLKVAEQTDPGAMMDFVDASISRSEELIQAQRVERRQGCSLIFAQLESLFTKRFLYTLRNWPQLITQFIIPLAILLLISYVSTFTMKLNDDQERSFSLETFGPSRIPVLVVKSSPISDAYLNLSSAGPGALVSQLGAGDNLTKWVQDLPKQLPAAGLGAVFEKSWTEVLFSSRAYHSLPSSLNLLDNARLKAQNPAVDGAIRTRLHAYTPPVTSASSSLRYVTSGFIDSVIAPILVLALSLLTSTFVMFLVEERVSKFAHQQSLTGISPITFWAASFLYDFIVYAIACACFLLIFVFSGWMRGYLHFIILFFVLYFWACVPFVYTVSFIFSSPSKANVLLIIWQVIAAFAAMMVLGLLSAGIITIDKSLFEVIRSILLCFLPSFALGNAAMTVGEASASKSPSHELWQWNLLGKNMTFMLIFGFFSSLLFVLFQFKTVRYRWHQIWDLRYGRRSYGRVGNDEEDGAVTEERNYVYESSDDMVLEVRDLCKMYGRLRAVDGLTMGVRRRECFGLLGVNGAGKTTTFDILTGQSFATCGTALIDKQDVTEQIPIGYCPQFDALLMDLTGRESLKILARMHGFPKPEVLAELVLHAVGMVDHADKLIRYYSGGQRRKISVGLALLAPTKIIILDEPTAGIDPKARREIWEVLSMMRDSSESSLLLTSHSMDECEALCSRIAILQKGRMIAIGTSQQLKSRFGNSFTITMVAPSVEERGDVIEGVQRAFPDAILKTSRESLTLSLKWQIPRRESDRWSTLFRDVQSLAASLGVVDFCVTQSSLEETFLRLSLENEGDDDESSSATIRV